MKKLFTLLTILFLLSPNSSIAETANGQAHEFSQLYDCTRKLQKIGTASNIDHDLEFLAPDLFYILDSHAPELYLFTPDFAGKADLSVNIKAEIKETLDANQFHSFPFTPCCQGGFSYNIRIPHLSLPQKGYYYIRINDPAPAMYDEVYWNGDEHKMHVKRHNEPYIKMGPHYAHSFGIPRFLPGKPQAMPDFTNYKPKEAENGITVTSVPGQEDKGIKYHPLTVENKLWDKTAQNNFSSEAKELLLADIRHRLSHLPKEHKVGQRSDCWGHAGCDYTYDKSYVAEEHTNLIDAVNTCKAVSDELLEGGI